jgi:hypothetical protein
MFSISFEDGESTLSLGLIQWISRLFLLVVKVKVLFTVWVRSRSAHGQGNYSALVLKYI